MTDEYREISEKKQKTANLIFQRDRESERTGADVGFADSCRILCHRISNKSPARPE